MNIDTGCKRKAKKHFKEKKWKRTKYPTRILKNNSNSWSDESEEFLTKKTSEKYDPLAYKFKEVNITPSKSENEYNEITSTDTESSENSVDCSESTNSFILLGNGDKISSEDEDSSYFNGSIIDEFIDENSCCKGFEIVSTAVVDIKNDIELPLKNEQNFVESKKGIEASNKKTQYRYTSDGIIVILSKSEIVYFHGLCLLSVLQGQVEILGHVLTKNSQEARVYSPRGTAHLYLKNITEFSTPLTYLPVLKKLRVDLTEKYAVVLCKKLEDSTMDFIEKHISQQILPKFEGSTMPRLVFEPKKGSFNLTQVGEKWDGVIDGIKEGTRLMICGGKGVGKTTFLRYAINRLLMKYGEVRVIDLDPGQSEFNVPGCISIVRVTTPVFGANYTHLQTTEKSILSNINIGYEPSKYIASVRILLDSQLSEIPTLINYMGYTHGMGINILSAVIIHVQPTDILQIISHDSKKNYKCALEKKVVLENAQLFVTASSSLNYSLIQIESMSDQNDGWTAESRQLREMCVLAYVQKMIDSDSIFTPKCLIYRVNLNDILITDLEGKEIHPAAVNACLVALCQVAQKEMQIFQCLGFGIIRGIDLFDNYLVLLTSASVEILDKVSHLVAGGATLPPSVYMTPDGVTGPMPYVMEGVLTSFGQITKRSRVSIK